MAEYPYFNPSESGATGMLCFQAVWSDSLKRPILIHSELRGGNIIGASHELLADSILVKTPDGYQIDGFHLRYIGESETYPHCSLFEVSEVHYDQ